MEKLILMGLFLLSLSANANEDFQCEIVVPDTRDERLTLKFDFFVFQGQNLIAPRYDSEFFINAKIPGCEAAVAQLSEGITYIVCFDPVTGTQTGSIAALSSGEGIFKFNSEGPIGYEDGGEAQLKNCKKINFTAEDRI